MKVGLEFTEPLLGTISGNKELTEEFIASKNPKGIDQEEIDAIPEDMLEKSSTIFPRDENGNLFLWDYQIKGFFKDACEAMIHTGTLKKKELRDVRLTQYMFRKTIDKLIFVAPRKVILQIPQNGKLGFCERPLRGQTMRGERIALARSEQAPVGTQIEFEIIVLNKNLTEFIKRWLDYGSLLGLGQWRNSGMGRFSWKEV